MTKLFIYAVAIIAGMSLSIEAAIGGALGERIGELESTYYIFIIGAMATFLVTLFFGKGNLKQIFTVPRWNLTGGLLGVVYLGLLVISVTLIGVGVSVTAVIVGQIVMSIIIEHFGLLGAQRIRLNANRLIAVGLLAVSFILIL
ncbi:DMT family transporter [Paenibacillus hunanensis]|uniref:DMT family transporter n=1 Tax=Paenibacillus hunanensis TaxID=539262 RepID=UPI002A6A1E0E|nr:DMT family transporter [Paenibacillus hunanensis]WPP43072.1 DMT family transporter [Paenibacillus hunanensis]